MKRWTIAVAFHWESSDDGIDCSELCNKTQYMTPQSSWKMHNEVFADEKDLKVSNTYSSREEAEKDYNWLNIMYEQWWHSGYGSNKKIFPDKIEDEFPDNCAEFITPLSVVEVDVTS